MKRKRDEKNKKRCSICGEFIRGKGMKVLIERAKVMVCQKCGQHAPKG